MDVSSLYPNIDHNEGISACEVVLSQRDYPLVPTSVLSNLIRLILQCNTLKFGERFFYQIKGTEMGILIWQQTLRMCSWEGLRDECYKIMQGFMTENQRPGYAILTISYFYGMEMKYL